ncbi:MAG: SurA N-terminal domain-containing protein [Neisseria sp.]|nr:SurA N-terminal domain-containing protein [Neisseria sp.]
MFVTVEKYSGSAKLLLALISLTFIGFGVSTVANPDADFIAKVGEQKVSQQDVQNALQQAQVSGSSDSSQTIFNGLLQRAYLLEGAADMGIGVASEQLKKVIVDDPSFHDENGSFSQQKFKQYLAQRHLNEDSFIQEIRSQFQLQNILNLAASGTLISDVQLRQIAGILEAKRTIRSSAFNPQVFASGIKADETVLKEFFSKNQTDYVLPKAIKFQYIVTDAASLAEHQQVSDEELQQAFEKVKKAARPEREVAHIMFTVPADGNKAQIKAEAEKVLAMAKAKPENFARLARQYSKDETTIGKGGSLGWITPQGWPQAFSDEAFKLEKGTVGNLVETPEGFHIVRVLDIRQGVSFEQEKPRLLAELKMRKAQQALGKLRVVLEEEAFATPDSLEAVARKAGLKVEHSNAWLSRQDAERNQIPSALIDALFGDEVFKKKHNSEPIEADGKIWVVRALETREQAEQTFEAVKEQVKQAYIAQQADIAARDKAKQAVEELNAGKQPSLSWSPSETITLEQARRTMPPQAFENLLKAKPQNGKPAYTILEGLPFPVVLEISEIKEPELQEEQRTALRSALAVRGGDSALDYLLNYLRSKLEYRQGAQKLEQSQQ